MNKIAVCVPYRNRKKHLDEFYPYISNMLKDQKINYSIIICNQVDDKPFNRGKLLNAAYLQGLKDGCDYFAFHDVDMLPLKGRDDYGFPEKYPVHLSSEIDEYEDSFPYKEYFGGCVLFSKDQFEKINGFSNDYWGWGYEDDDLFFRCKEKSLIKSEYTKFNLANRNVAKFNGNGSSIVISSTESIKSIGAEDYSISLTIRPTCLKKMAPYIYGDEDSCYISSTILSRCGFDIISYCNSQVINHTLWYDSNSPIETWAKSKHEQWLNITLTYNKIESTISIFSNGVKTNSIKVEENVRKYYNSPFLIGDSDVPIWNKSETSCFVGDISEICFWDRCISDKEIGEMYEKDNYSPIKNGLKLHFDFSEIKNGYVCDLSGFENHGKLNNIEIKNQNIGRLIKSQEPYRRKNKYFTLEHEKQGVVNGTFVQKSNSVKNAKYLFEKIVNNNSSFCGSGISDIDFNILEKREIDKSCFMYDVVL